MVMKDPSAEGEVAMLHREDVPPITGTIDVILPLGGRVWRGTGT